MDVCTVINIYSILSNRVAVAFRQITCAPVLFFCFIVLLLFPFVLSLRFFGSIFFGDVLLFVLFFLFTFWSVEREHGL